MRSVIKQANAGGHQGDRRAAVRDRQADRRGRARPDHRARSRHPLPGQGGGRRAAARAILEHLNALDPDQIVMLKLTLPEKDDFYADCIAHPNVATRRRALRRLLARRSQRAARQTTRHGRELLARAGRGPHGAAVRREFNAMLDASIQTIFDASST